MAAFYLADFERVTDEAFSFLSTDHGYTASPAKRGGHLGSGFYRGYFRGPYQVGVGFRNADAHHLCAVEFRDDLGQDIAERSYMARELVTLLAQRYPSFAPPTLADLSRGMTPEGVVVLYAKLVREYALDVVEGDFSAYPPLVYVLHHVDRKFPGGAVRRLLGIYSTYDRVIAAIEERRPKRGYAQRSDGFEIWRVQVDGGGFWFAGIPLDDPRENRG